MTETAEKLQRQYERQMNDLIGKIHVQETILLITLQKMLGPQPNSAALLRQLKEEVVDRVSQTNAISKDPQDTQRLRGSHALLAEKFFQPLESYFERDSKRL